MPARRVRRRNPYGVWGAHKEIFELFESWRDDPEAQQALAESEGWLEEDSAGLEEAGAGAGVLATGSPEGRADLPIFLLTTLRHTMRQAFTRRAARWDQYMGPQRAEDFRQHTVSQLNGLTGMGPVPEFDEYPRLRSSEEMGPPYSVGKHGGVYSVTFEMVVNDDTNLILNRTPNEMGRMSAAYVSQVALAMIESNPNWIDGLPFFTAAAREGLPQGNLLTGGGAEPTEDNLVSIIEQMLNTTDFEGFPIDIEPDNILTRSTRVRVTFKRIMRSQETGVTVTNPPASTVDKGTMNPLAGDELLPGQVIVETYLKDPNDWTLFANVNRPAFVIAFLRDQREPFIGIEDPGIRDANGGSSDPYTLDFDAIRFKLRHVFGVALGDPRAAIKASRA